MAELIATTDWTTSPLGHPSAWPQSLKSTVDLILPAAAQIVVFWGQEFVPIYNDAYAPAIGENHPRALGRPARENWAELWDDLEPLLQKVRDTGQTVRAKDRPFYVERYGYPETVYFDISYSPIRDESDSVAGVLCIVSETTERVQSEQRMLADRERLTQMFEQSPTFMALVRGPQHIFEIANSAYSRLIGEREVIGLPIRTALPEVAEQGFVRLLDSVYESGKPHVGLNTRVLIERVKNAPEERFVDFVYQPMRNDGGQVTGILVQGSDVTERHLAEERLRLAVENAEIGFWDVEDGHGDLTWPARTKALFGISAEAEVTMDDFYAGLHPDDLPRVADAYAAAADPEKRAFYDVEYRTIGKEDGIERWVAAKGRGIFADDGPHARCVRVVGTAIDITARKRSEEALRQSDARLRAALDASESGTFRWDIKTNELEWDRALDKLFGLLPGETARSLDQFVALIHPDDRAAVAEECQRCASEGSDFGMEFRVVRPDGETRWLYDRGKTFFGRDGKPAVMSGACVDITDRKLAEQALTALNETLESRVAEEIERRSQAEEALRQTQKMETVGQLSGGIAHDFNNLLQIIQGNLSLLQRMASDQDDRFRRAIANAMSGTERAAALTTRLLAFSRRQELDPKPTDLNRLILDMTELLHRTLGEQVTVETRLESHLESALVDANQLENAILNLAINARDAMPRGGTLEISTSEAVLTDRDANLHADARPGRYVRIAVKDDGEGMSNEVRERAVEPFFSTKDVGQGTGLGLSMVYGFVQQSGGHLVITSKVGRGTTVELLLPVSSRAAEAQERTGHDSDLPMGNGERILLCEDNDDVRFFSSETLTDLGYDVIEASDANSALALLRDRRDIDLLFTDVVLPGAKTGADLAREARLLRPNLKVLFTTGYARSALDRERGGERGVDLLLKPFGVDALALKLQEMLR